MDVTVAAEDDVELRRLTVTNRSLAQPPAGVYQLRGTGARAASRRYRSSGLRENVRRDRSASAKIRLIAHRRPRSPEDPPIWAAHLLVGATSGIQHETDRAIFWDAATPSHRRTRCGRI